MEDNEDSMSITIKCPDCNCLLELTHSWIFPIGKCYKCGITYHLIVNQPIKLISENKVLNNNLE